MFMHIRYDWQRDRLNGRRYPTTTAVSVKLAANDTKHYEQQESTKVSYLQ